MSAWSLPTHGIPPVEFPWSVPGRIVEEAHLEDATEIGSLGFHSQDGVKNTSSLNLCDPLESDL